MSDIENIKRKISALMAKAESTDNENEALAFMSKAKDLLDQHQIDALTLGTKNDLMGQQFGATWKEGNPYKRDLFFAVSAYYGCKGISVSRYKKDPIGMICGRESARIVFGYMWPFILKQVTREAKKLPNVKLTEARRQVSDALRLRIAKLNLERENTESLDQRKSGLILLDELDLFVEKNYPELRKVSKPYSMSRKAMELANNISLSEQLKRKSEIKRIGN